MLPHKFEAGTPNVADAVGLAAAWTIWSGSAWIGSPRTSALILATAISSLEAIDGVRLYGPPLGTPERRGVSFIVDDIHPHDLATMLDRDGRLHPRRPPLRAAAHAPTRTLPATARASFYVYNDARDVERLAEGIAHAQEMFAPPR